MPCGAHAARSPPCSPADATLSYVFVVPARTSAKGVPRVSISLLSPVFHSSCPCSFSSSLFSSLLLSLSVVSSPSFPLSKRNKRSLELSQLILYLFFFVFFFSAPLTTTSPSLLLVVLLHLLILHFLDSLVGASPRCLSSLPSSFSIYSLEPASLLCQFLTSQQDSVISIRVLPQSQCPATVSRDGRPVMKVQPRHPPIPPNRPFPQLSQGEGVDIVASRHGVPTITRGDGIVDWVKDINELLRWNVGPYPRRR